MSFMRNLEETIFHLVSNNVRSWTHDSIKNTKVYTVINPKRESAACMYLTWQAVEQQKQRPVLTKLNLHKHTQIWTGSVNTHSSVCASTSKRAKLQQASVCETPEVQHEEEKPVNKGRAASCESPNTLTRDTTLSSHTDRSGMTWDAQNTYRFCFSSCLGAKHKCSRCAINEILKIWIVCANHWHLY